MDINQLEQLITQNTSQGTLTLASDLFAGQPLAQLMADYFPAGKLIITNAGVDPAQGNRIDLRGEGGSLPLTAMSIRATLAIVDEQVTLDLTAQPVQWQQWQLDDSFPVLQNPFFPRLAYTTAPQLHFGTAVEPEGKQPGLYFSGQIQVEAVLGPLSILFGDVTELEISGLIAIEDTLPKLLLATPPTTGLHLAFLELEAVALELVTDLDALRNPTPLSSTTFLRLRAGLGFDSGASTTLIHVGADIHYKGYVRFRVDLQDIIQASMQAFANLLPGADLSSSALQPDGLPLGKVVQFKQLTFDVDPNATDKLRAITVGVGTGGPPWQIADAIALDALLLTLRLSDPLGRKVLTSALSAEIAVGGGLLEVSASFPDFEFQAWLKEGTEINLAEVLDHFFGADAAAGIGLDLLSISVFDLTFKPSPLSYSGQIEIDADWYLFLQDQMLTLKQLAFQFEKPGPSEPTGGKISGAIAVAGVDIAVTADHPQGATGWQFTGAAAIEQPIPIGTLLADLAKTFAEDAQGQATGLDHLPDALRSLEFKGLHASFNTESYAFTFSGAADFTVGGRTVDILVDINLQHHDSFYQKHVSGQIKVGDLAFTLIFDQNAKATHFLATYQELGSGAIHIGSLLAAVSSDQEIIDIGNNLEIELKDALFVYDKAQPRATGAPAGATQESRMFLALDIGGGINLSNLPLINKLFNADQTLRVVFQPVIASQPFSQSEVATIKSLLPNGGIPLPDQALVKGMALAITLRIGDTPIQLALPFKMDQASGQLAHDPTAVQTLPTPASATPADDGTQWVDIQKALGPIHFNRIGINYATGDLWFMLDAGLEAGGLTLTLDGLGAGINISQLTKGDFAPTFALRGLGLDFAEGALEIAGAFLRETITDPVTNTSFDSYDGMLTVKTETVTLTAIGGYAYVEGHTSIFVYLIVDYPLGGPDFFYVKGLSAGFGYNRDFIAPPIDGVIDFPLVAEVMKPPNAPSSSSSGVAGATSGQNRFDKLQSEMQSLQRYVPPKVGQYFLAAGLRFTSFELLDSFILLSVTFGKRLEVDILGISSAVIPTPEGDSPHLAEIQMELKASYIPDEGLIEFRAQLTSSSYILDRDCHLTGGFAFLAWFKGDHAGDFVVTLGGYHKQFVVPANYPQVPPLGFNWHLSDELSIKGDAYFALTPHALMAGGHLNANFHTGPVDAWIAIGADFLIAWKPFHYDLQLYVSIGASLTLDMGLFTTHVTVELGGDLHLWGPKFAGKVQIHYFVISVTVSFGDSDPQAKPLNWDQFRQSFLPLPQPSATPSPQDPVCTIVLQSGLIKTIESGGKEYWVVNPKALALVTNATIPSSTASPNPGERYQAGDSSSIKPISAFTIGPMGLKKGDITSAQKIEVTGPDGNDAFAFEPVLKSVPAGLWDELPADTLKPDLNGKRMIDNVLTGFKMTPAKEPVPGITHDIQRQKLQYSTTTIENAYHYEPAPVVSFVTGERSTIATSLNTKDVVDKRNALLKAMGFVQPEATTHLSQELVFAFTEMPQIVE